MRLSHPSAALRAGALLGLASLLLTACGDSNGVGTSTAAAPVPSGGTPIVTPTTPPTATPPVTPPTTGTPGGAAVIPASTPYKAGSAQRKADPTPAQLMGVVVGDPATTGKLQQFNLGGYGGAGTPDSVSDVANFDIGGLPASGDGDARRHQPAVRRRRRHPRLQRLLPVHARRVRPPRRARALC